MLLRISMFVVFGFFTSTAFSAEIFSVESDCTVFTENKDIFIDASGGFSYVEAGAIPFDLTQLSAAPGCAGYVARASVMQTKQVSDLVTLLTATLKTYEGTSFIEDTVLKSLGYEKSVIFAGYILQTGRANASSQRIVNAAVQLASQGLVYADSNHVSASGILKKADYVESTDSFLMSFDFESDFSKSLNDYGIAYSTNSDRDMEYALLPGSTNYNCTMEHPQYPGLILKMAVSISADKKTVRLASIVDGLWSEARSEGNERLYFTEPTALGGYLGEPNMPPYDDAYLVLNTNASAVSLAATMQYGGEGRTHAEVKDCSPAPL